MQNALAAACTSASVPGHVTATRAYHEKVIDHYENPRNVGSFDKKDPKVGTGLVGAPACGDVMKLQIEVDDVRFAESLLAPLPPNHPFKVTSILIKYKIGIRFWAVYPFKKTNHGALI